MLDMVNILDILGIRVKVGLGWRGFAYSLGLFYFLLYKHPSHCIGS